MNAMLKAFNKTQLIRSLALACLALGTSQASQADIVYALDEAPADGRLTLAADASEATLTDSAGKTRSIKLADLDEVRFGEDLVVVRSGNLKLIDNDRNQTMTRQTGKIKLRQGLHRFVVPYWQGDREYGLRLTVTGPGISGESELNGDLMRCFRDEDTKHDDSPGIDGEGFRLPELALEAGEDRRQFLSRARYRFYVGDKAMAIGNMSVLERMTLKRSGTTTAIDTGLVQDPNTYIGLVFEAFFRAPKDGEYTFALTCDDGGQLYFGRVDRFNAQGIGIEAGPQPWRAELKPANDVIGEIVGIKDDTLTMKLALGDATPAEVSVSLPQVAELWDARQDLSQVNRDNEPADQDTAYIRDKDDPALVRSVNGRITSLSDEAMSFVFRGQERTIARDRVVGMVFANSDRPKPADAGFHQSLRLRTGQVLAGKVVAIGDRVEMDLLGGGRVDLPRAALISMRSENGRRIDLTRIKPTAEEAIPYFGLAMPSVLNRSFDNGMIRLFDQNNYEQGIAVHSKSRLHYKLDRPAQSFRATFGLMDPGGKLGDVTARVIGDDKILWEQKNITAQSGAVNINVDLKDVKRLILEVDFGDGQNVGDRAAWCNPQIIYAQD